jgi:hypothetical protein
LNVRTIIADIENRIRKYGSRLGSAVQEERNFEVKKEFQRASSKRKSVFLIRQSNHPGFAPVPDMFQAQNPWFVPFAKFPVIVTPFLEV